MDICIVQWHLCRICCKESKDVYLAQVGTSQCQHHKTYECSVGVVMFQIMGCTYQIHHRSDLQVLPLFLKNTGYHQQIQFDDAVIDSDEEDCSDQVKKSALDYLGTLDWESMQVSRCSPRHVYV